MIPLDTLTRYAVRTLLACALLATGYVAGLDRSPSVKCQQERRALQESAERMQEDRAFAWLVASGAVAEAQESADRMLDAVIGTGNRHHAAAVAQLTSEE